MSNVRGRGLCTNTLLCFFVRIYRILFSKGAGVDTPSLQFTVSCLTLQLRPHFLMKSPEGLFCGLYRGLPFYPIRFLTGNPDRRCVVLLLLARSLKLKSWQTSPKKYQIGRSCTFTPDTNIPGVQRKPVNDVQFLSRRPINSETSMIQLLPIKLL